MIMDYSKYLGLDTNSIMDDFNEFVFESTSKIPLDDIEKASKLKEDEEKIASPYTKKEEEKSKLPLILGIILGVLIIIFIIVYFYNKNQDIESSDNIKISYETEAGV